jgi:murein DD-endopeptidase MepM/ murein hydrolase activator NlpD
MKETTDMVWPLPGVLPMKPPLHGQYGAVRKHDVHTGVDLYAPDGASVIALEPGVVVAVGAFTGAQAGSPWWADTSYVMVDGPSGVLLYGEVSPTVSIGDRLDEGHPVGNVKRVLVKDKGLPTSMLHVELYSKGTRVCCESWLPGQPKPEGLQDPSPLFTVYLEEAGVG